jgi:polyisoprenoid-binding protein YceI
MVLTGVMTTTSNPEVLTGTYTLDPTHSRVGFVARHAMVTKVRGSFNDITGEGFFDASNPAASKFSVTIQATSIDTRTADRDTHLKSNDFFEMDTYPTITFASTAVSGSGETYSVTGDLTLKGVTKSISFDLELSGPAKDPFGNERIGLEGSVQVNRKDWNLSWNAPLETGGVLIGEKVTLEFEVSAVKSAS